MAGFRPLLCARCCFIGRRRGRGSVNGEIDGVGDWHVGVNARSSEETRGGAHEP
jgi:hypothetical protein